MTTYQMIKNLGVFLCTTSLIVGIFVIWFQPEFVKPFIWTHVAICSGFTLYFIKNEGEKS